jgi:DNA-binding MarR family transcriptional regulator
MQPTLFRLVQSLKARCIAAETRIQRTHDLSQAEFHGLLAIAEKESLTGAAFAERICLSVSRASRVSSKLLARGFVTLTHGTSDRRSVSVQLTKEGAAARRRIESDLHDCEQTVLSAIPPAEQKQLLASVALLIENLH